MASRVAKMVSKGRLVLRTTRGVIIMEAETPTPVPPALQSIALERGAVYMKGEAPKDDDSPLPSVEQDAIRRAKALADLLPKIAARNLPGDFTAAGIPTVEACEKFLGFRPEDTEVQAAWREYQAAAMDPDAQSEDE